MGRRQQQSAKAHLAAAEEAQAAVVIPAPRLEACASTLSQDFSLTPALAAFATPAVPLPAMGPPTPHQIRLPPFQESSPGGGAEVGSVAPAPPPAEGGAAIQEEGPQWPGIGSSGSLTQNASAVTTGSDSPAMRRDSLPQLSEASELTEKSSPRLEAGGAGTPHVPRLSGVFRPVEEPVNGPLDLLLPGHELPHTPATVVDSTPAEQDGAEPMDWVAAGEENRPSRKRKLPGSDGTETPWQDGHNHPEPVFFPTPDASTPATLLPPFSPGPSPLEQHHLPCGVPPGKAHQQIGLPTGSGSSKKSRQLGGGLV
jgi:hypothetical protein